MDSLVENLSFSSNCRVAEWMNLLCSCQIWQEIWQPLQDENSVRIGLLLVGHVMAKEDPPPSLDNAYESDWFKNIWQLKLTLAGNAVVCETLEDLWNEHKLVASAISGTTLQTMALGLVDIHPNIVNPGLKNFLQMKSPSFPTDIVNGEQVICNQTVNHAVLQFVDLVNEVKHLEMDAGHWHELWEEGESIGLCIILHYIKHEKRSRLEQLGRIRNVNACINSNIRKLKSALAAFPDLVLELIKLWKRRPDIAKHIDGDTLRELANDLRGDVTRVQKCFIHLSKKLPERWGDEYGRAQKPTAYLYTCVHNFIHGPDHIPDMPPQSNSPTFSLGAFPPTGQQLPSPRFPFVPNGLAGPQQGSLPSPRFPVFPSGDLSHSQATPSHPLPSPRFHFQAPSKPSSNQDFFTSPRFQLLSQINQDSSNVGPWNLDELLPRGHTASAAASETLQLPAGCHNPTQHLHPQGPKLKAYHSRRPSVWANPNTSTCSAWESGNTHPQSVWSHSTGSSSLMTGRSSPQSICPESPHSSFTTVSRPEFELIQSGLLVDEGEPSGMYLGQDVQGIPADSSVNKVQSWLQWGDSWQNMVAGGLVNSTM